MNFERTTLIVVAVIGIVFLLDRLFPPISYGHPTPVRKVAQQELLSLVAGANAYSTEYGLLPEISGGALRVESLDQQVELISILLGQNMHGRNPKRIDFISSSEGKLEPGKPYLDPWKHPYQLQFLAGEEDSMSGPYSDGAKIKMSVIAWSLGRDGVLGSKEHPGVLEGSDDVVTWK